MKYINSYSGLINENWQSELKNRIEFLDNEFFDDLTLALREELDYQYAVDRQVKKSSGEGLTSKGEFFKGQYYPYYVISMRRLKYIADRGTIDLNDPNAIPNFTNNLTKINNLLKVVKEHLRSFTVTKLLFNIPNESITIEFYEQDKMVDKYIVPPPQGAIRSFELSEWVEEWVEELKTMGISKKGNHPFFEVSKSEDVNKYTIMLRILHPNRDLGVIGDKPKTHEYIVSSIVNSKKRLYHKISYVVSELNKNVIFINIKK